MKITYEHVPSENKYDPSPKPFVAHLNNEPLTAHLWTSRSWPT